MNILYHHRTQAKGVEGVHISEIVKALRDLGHNVDVVSPYGVNARDKETLQRENSVKPNKIYTGISKFFPEFCFEILELLYNFKAAKLMRALSKNKKYDLIYERYAIFNCSGVKFAKKHKIPIILEVNYTSFTPLYRKRSRILKPLANRLDRKIFNEATGLVVVSTYLKNHLISLGVDEKKIIVLTNAADPEKFNPALSGEEIKKIYGVNGNKVIGFIGGFYPWHGLDLLVDAFADIKKELKDAVLFLIGEGPARKAIEDKVKGLGLEKSVLLFGKVAHSGLPSYIAAFDVAVMPDSNDYGSPMKIYEYMAMGKPVVAPRLGPLEDGITDGREGLLFTPKDKKGLYEALKTLLVDNELRNKMGHSARENIVSKHTWQKNAESILGLYNYLRTTPYALRNNKKRILFITPRIPYPPLKGDRIRPYNFIKELAKRHTVDLCTFYEFKKDLKGVDEMLKYCGKVETVLLKRWQSYVNILRSALNFKPLQVNYYNSVRMERKITEMIKSGHYDIVQIVLQRMMPYARYCNGSKVILDQIDALSLNMKRRAINESNFIKKAVLYYEYLIMTKYETNNRHIYDACIITSDVDKEALHDQKIIVVPNGVDTSYFTPVDVQKDIDIVFTGNMGYFPNMEAAVYLCKTILTKVLKTYPDIKVYIVGADPTSEVKALADNINIFVTGYVEDIRQYLNRAKLFVAPLCSGSGIQNKILEAMACGLPVITTSYGNAGVKAEDRKQLMIAQDVKDFEKILHELIIDRDRRESIGDCARFFVEKEFSWSNRAEKLESIYNG